MQDSILAPHCLLGAPDFLVLSVLGRIAAQQQDFALAKARYRESLALYRRLGNANYTAWCLEGIGAQASAPRAASVRPPG